MNPEPQLLHAGQFLHLYRRGHWEYAQRPSRRGAVFVAAVTPARELVLVEQYRVPLQARTLELPAGILGDEAAHADEAIEACAARELLEETGYRASSTRHWLTGPVAAGMTSELLYLVRAEGLVKTGPGGGVDGEDITVHLAPMEGIHAWLQARQAAGLMIEPRVYTALYFLSLETPAPGL